MQQQALQSGQVDVAGSVPVENIAKLAKNPKFKVTRDASSLNYLGFFNTMRPPLDNVLVRRALAYAIPYKDILTVGAGGYGTQSRSAVPKGIFPYSPTTPQYTQNLAKAKALLAQAGHKGGGFSLDLTYAAENAAEASVRTADQGRVQEDRRHGERQVAALQPAVEAREGRPDARRRTSSCSSTGRPTATPAPTTCGRCSTRARSRSST